MNQISRKDAFSRQVFGDDMREKFGRCYPEQPQLLDHDMAVHDLLTLDALAKLGTALPKVSVEYNPGDLPVGIDPKDVPDNGMSIADTILMIENSASWAVLKNIEQVPEYEALLLSLLGEIKPILERKTGKMLRPQGFIFVSSPNAMTPYHFDPEHNILLQLRGEKTMTVFPAGDEKFAPATAHESYEPHVARLGFEPCDAGTLPEAKYSEGHELASFAETAFGEMKSGAFNGILMRSLQSLQAPYGVFFFHVIYSKVHTNLTPLPFLLGR